MMAQLEDVNSTDLRDAIRLGCRAMGFVFNADDPQGVAFFDTVGAMEDIGAALRFFPALA